MHPEKGISLGLYSWVEIVTRKNIYLLFDRLFIIIFFVGDLLNE
jgi:hypothetical protein